MEEQEDSWLTVLEKNGLGPAAAILDNYGIDSETDLLVLVRNPPLLRASFSRTHSMLSPWNHMSMVHQLQLL
jgi:hypothetical protein